MKKTVNYFALVLVICCAVLWVAAPFMAVNLLTLEDQPTALQLILDDVPYLGDLYEADAFRLAAAIAGGIVICFVAVLCKSGAVPRLGGGASLAMMGWEVYRVYEAFEDPEAIAQFFGFGFFAIAAGFLLLLLFGGAVRK